MDGGYDEHDDIDQYEPLSGKTNQDCKDKDGNNPVTLGLENMRGVINIVLIININITIISIIIVTDNQKKRV